MTEGTPDIEREVERLVRRSCLLLDEERFDAFLELCAPDFHYELRAYSSEIRKDMTWLAATRDELAGLFGTLSQHVRVEGDLLRQASVSDMEIEADGDEARAVSSLAIFYTDLDGQSRLLATGRYHDTVTLNGGRPLLSERVVRLQTRVFDNDAGGSHVPF